MLTGVLGKAASEMTNSRDTRSSAVPCMQPREHPLDESPKCTAFSSNQGKTPSGIPPVWSWSSKCQKAFPGSTNQLKPALTSRGACLCLTMSDSSALKFCMASSRLCCSRSLSISLVCSERAFCTSRSRSRRLASMRACRSSSFSFSESKF